MDAVAANHRQLRVNSSAIRALGSSRRAWHVDCNLRPLGGKSEQAMKTINSLVTGIAAMGAFAGALVSNPTPARAEEVVTEHHVTTGADVKSVSEETVPNTGLIASGVILFGASYASSLVVAAGTSDYDPDKKLYIPVAGPWMDLADRKGDCGRGANAPSCDNEDLYDVLLVADGIAQGVGALQVIGGFVFPVHRTTVTEAKVVITPRFSPNMLGVSALGVF